VAAHPTHNRKQTPERSSIQIPQTRHQTQQIRTVTNNDPPIKTRLPPQSYQQHGDNIHRPRDGTTTEGPKVQPPHQEKKLDTEPGIRN